MALFIASNDLFTYNKNAHGVGIMKENKYSDYLLVIEVGIIWLFESQ